MEEKTNENGSGPASPETLEELERAKVLLWSLLQDTGRRMEKAEASRQELERNLTEFRSSFQRSLGHMNVFRQEEMRTRLGSFEREASQFDEELRTLRQEYDYMLREYSKLCE